MRTQIGLLNGLGPWLICIAIILIASIGKFGGSAVAAAFTGLGWRDSLALGTLMNTRGLMELIVLNIALEMNVISPTLFAMLVLMALVTTFATTPILDLITRGELREKSAREKARLAALRSVQRPILVPISNPMGIAPLLGLAAAATGPEDQPPRVLALVRTPYGGVRSGLREVEYRVAPRSATLVAALEYAQSIGSTVVPEAIWTNDPSRDILDKAMAMQAGWVLLGFHRPAFGANAMGGVVGKVLGRAKELPLHVGVVTHGHMRPVERVFAAVDDTPDGQAALDLAGRIARGRNCSLHALLVPKNGGEPEPQLLDVLKNVGRFSGRWLHTDVLRRATPDQLNQQTRGELVIVGAALADELQLPINDRADADRCLVVVQSGATQI
jgi:nucleotide-binding universal stress UspA family protein